MNIEIISKPIAATSCLINGKEQKVPDGFMITVQGEIGGVYKKMSFFQYNEEPCQEDVQECIEILKFKFENA